MKIKIKTAFKKHTLLLFYIAALLIFIANGFFNFALDVVSMPPEQTLALSDFTLNQLELTSENTLVSTGDDPYMVYSAPNEKTRTIYYSLSEDASGTICAYYAKQGEDFSNHKRLFPSFGEYNEAFYIFPHSNAHTIRIDLGNAIGANFTFNEIALNRQISFFSYFSLSQRQFLILALAPLLLYSIFVFVKESLNNLKNRDKGVDV